MAKGLPASIIKKYGVTKKAWAVFRGRHPKKSKVSNPSRKGVKRRMAKKKGRRRGGFTLPIAFILGAAGGAFSPTYTGASPITQFQRESWEHGLNALACNYVGIDVYNVSKPWDITRARGLMMLLVGYGVHKLASVVGINRALGRARVPIIRI